jgi:hypothetical protein
VVLNVVSVCVAPTILIPWLVLFILVVVFLVNISSILLEGFRIAVLVPTLSILVSLLSKLTTRVLTIIFLDSCGLSNALVSARFDVEPIVIRVGQI